MKIKSFVKQVAIIAIGFFISLVALCALVVVGFLTFTASHPKKVADNSVLTLNMEGQVVESMPMSLFGSNKGMIDFKAVQNAIHKATKDSRITAIYLDLSNLTAGWASLEEIREKLLAFKKEGKSIIAYGESYTQRSYYLASVADEIILNPSGLFEFKGLAATVYFYTKLLEHIGVKPIIFRTGAHKDYAESFCLTKMSEESRAQTKAYLESINNHFLTKISTSRDIAVATLKAHATNLSAVLPNDALHANLITRIGYETDAKKLLKEKLESPSFINYSHYTTPVASSDLPDKVAVLVAEGMIINGPSGAGCIGAHDFIKRVEAIQEDPTIKALVLRINSPGGSGFASDVIWKAIEELKSVKPVVASMSNVAASAGYEIAVPCNYIFAQPTTITGSIGVLGIFPDPSALMDKIGVHYDAVKTASSADFLSPRLSCSELESKFIHKKLQSSYDDFLRKVSNGRKMDLVAVEKLAGGRVYTGLAALQNGLVDELGGLDTAIAKAASLANLTQRYGVCYLPRSKTRLEQLLNYTTYNIKMEAFNSLVQAYPILNHYKILSRSNGVQAILPYTIDIN